MDGRAARCNMDTHMRVGIFLPNWVGDVVMATPALRSLRNHLGSDGTLVGIMRPYVADVLKSASPRRPRP